jgi:hypothetical protein
MAQIEGVRSTITELRKVDASLARQAILDVKAPAIPVAGRLQSVAPAVPLSRMGFHGPTRASVRYGGKKYTDGSYPLVRIRLTAPGWTVASDMARKSSPGESMVPNLSQKYGSASRWAWPTVEASRASIIAAITLAAKKVEKQTTERLAQ